MMRWQNKWQSDLKILKRKLKYSITNSCYSFEVLSKLTSKTTFIYDLLLFTVNVLYKEHEYEMEIILILRIKFVILTYMQNNENCVVIISPIRAIFSTCTNYYVSESIEFNP